VRIATVSRLKMMLPTLLVIPRTVLNEAEARLGSLAVASFSRCEMWYFASSLANPLLSVRSRCT